MSSTKQRERRASPRRRERFLHVAAPAVGEVLNISGEGLCIETNAPFPVGVTRKLKLERGGATATLVAKVCWCRLTSTFRSAELGVVPVYLAGVRVADPAALEQFAPVGPTEV